MEQQGSIAIEAALVIPVLLLVAVAAVELVSVGSTQIQLAAAAREGARVAAVAPDPAEAVAAVRRVLPSTREARVSVERPAVVGAPATVVVRVDKPLVTPLLDVFTVPMRAKAAMRVETP